VAGLPPVATAPPVPPSSPVPPVEDIPPEDFELAQPAARRTTTIVRMPMDASLYGYHEARGVR